MKLAFYPRLALDGIRKNRRLYFPYLMAGAITVTVHYILSFLADSSTLANMRGGDVLMSVLPMGYWIIAIFSALFLFYTNSFLVRQRYREFGLYNILGMDKKNIGRIMLWEAFFAAAIAISAGLLAGIAFSKAAELVLLNMLSLEINFKLSIGFGAILRTSLVYGVIYALLFINSLIRVARSRPLELVRSSKVGEKIPKYNWLFAVIGLVLLAAAYYLAFSIKEPLTAFIWFFVSVILVISGTYLLFISGSVAFCRLLQKNKKYYYNPRHFVSVSSMVYRMKRNGAGLASICILLTMVLVTLSSTACLYFSGEDAIKNKCPFGVNIRTSFNSISGISDESLELLRDAIRPYCGTDTDLTGVRTCNVPGLITEDGIIIDFANYESPTVSYDRVGYLSVLSLEDYNRLTGESKTLSDRECLMGYSRLDLGWTSFTMEYGQTYTVKEQLAEFELKGDTEALITPTVYLVVNDPAEFSKPISDMKNSSGEPMMVYSWRCGFDSASPEEENRIAGMIDAELHMLSETADLHSFSTDSRDRQRDHFYDMFGSLFFLGLTLSAVFAVAAVLIIYYKQISEGYEDQNRFEIMQKIGMTRRDIRSSINSQMLTVFFLPLVLAGVHLAFAHPFVSKILLMFFFDNRALSIAVNLSVLGILGIFYAIVYRITSGTYYSIVSGKAH